MFQENMNSEIYMEILSDFLLPFMAAHFNITEGVLHQDNDPKHTSRLCKDFLVNSGISWIKAPANSPDLNPIEMFWNQLKDFVRNKLCQSPEQIENAVLEFSETITPQICTNYISHLYKVIPIIIDRQGGWSGH